MRHFIVVLLCALLGSVVAAPDLIIKNSCSFGLWAEGRAAGNALIPGETNAIKYVAPGQSVSYTVPPQGLVSTRFWAKYGCDSAGKNCIMGDQVGNSALYGSAQCPTGGCHPPVDSLFEATWGCKATTGCVTTRTTWFDTSQVDGWTIPYRVLLAGQGTTQCDCTNAGCKTLTLIDGSKLDLAQCPANEDLSNRGAFPQYANQNLRIVKNGKVVGCKSPCKHFNLPPVQTGLGLFEGSNPAVWYCCPTPNANNCQVSQGCLLPEQCRAGPIPTTKFVDTVHRLTDGIYAYSYDDLEGLHTCPATGVTYTMEYCPPGSAAYPYTPGTSTGPAATQAPSSSSSGSSGTTCPPFDPNTHVCTNGHLCPKASPNWCSNGACYNPTSYKCCNGALAPATATC